MQMDKGIQLAYDRTWLAYERTMQAWVRTAISCITFGFTVFKLSDIAAEDLRQPHVAGPHEIGVVLVAVGFLSLVFATIEYRQNITLLRREYGQSPRSSSVWFAAVIALVGIFALLSMLFRF